MKNNILLPIEIITREIDYKLILAAMCSDGDSVYVGQHDYLYLASKFMTGGIYVGKNQFSIYPDGSWRDRHSKLKENGFNVIHLDEEGVFWGDDENHRQRLSRRIDVDQIENNDYICTWGRFQKNHYQNETIADSDNIVITGNPRFNLLTSQYRGIYDERVNELKDKYNDFILIPTAFGLFNNILGHDDSFSKRRLFSNKYNVEEYVRQVSEWNYSGKTFCEYIKMISSLSVEFTDLNIIVRPHPAENIDVYQSAFSSFKNIIVIYSGEVQPWIIASKILIQDGCTTALEAYISNTPVINFQPFYNTKSNTFLTSLVSEKTDKIEGVFDLVRNLMKGPCERKVINKKGVDLLINLKEGVDSFEAIMTVIQKNIHLRQGKGDDKINNILFYFFRVRYWIMSSVKNIIRVAFKEKREQYKAFNKPFPGFDKEDIKRKIEKIEKITNKRVNIKFVNKNLMVLTREK